MLADREFLRDLDEAASEIRKGATPDATEATITGYFERILYAALRDIGIKFHPQKEESINYIRHIGRGRMDSRIGNVVIEYKRPALLKTENQITEAQGQLENYLISLSKRNNAPVRGFLTEGLKILTIHAIEGQIVSRTAPEKLNGRSLLYLTRTLVSLDLTALTTENLIRDFCGTTWDGLLFDAARLLDEILVTKPSPKTEMLKSEWEELFRLAHEDKSQQKRIEERQEALGEIFKKTIQTAADEYRSLFALHTAYAIVLKFIAFKVVSDLYFGKKDSPYDYKSLLRANPDSLRSSCSSLENGDMFRKLGIVNLLEGDFFSWYCDKTQWTLELAQSIKNILEVLVRYEEASTIFDSADAVDLFRKLYEGTVPQVVRSSFGEFYTPNWLAEHVLQSTEPRGRWRVLDPCCGSGTFIIVAISRIIKECKELPKNQLLTEVLERVVAIDLNPLAVLTTRINYFIHIYNLLPEKLNELIIPVYLGDSTRIPTYTELGGVVCLEYELSTLKDPIKTVLPVSLVENTDRFVKLMQEYEKEIRYQKDKRASGLLLEAIPLEDKVPEVCTEIQVLSKQLVELEKKRWNGIWARILSNFLTTACLGRFSIIVGNPPWIDWKNLPAGYRNRIKSMCIDRGLFSGAGRTGGINLNVCALIAYVAMNNWLMDSGKFAFLMPRELANQASYEGWRNLPGDVERGFLHFYDWSKAGHPYEPVQEDFMTYVIGKEDSKNDHVPVLEYHKRRGKRPKATEWKDWHEASKHLEKKQGVAGQIIPTSTAYTFADSLEDLKKFEVIAGECQYIGREGIEFYPQELLLFTFDSEGPKEGTVYLRNVKRQKSKYALPSRRVLLETKYLHPLVKGPQIKPFEHSYEGLIVPFPYEPENPLKPVEVDKLRETSPLLFDYYLENREVIEAQTDFSDKIRGAEPGEFYGLARTGPYTFPNVHVGYRDNTKWRAVVVTSCKMPWGEEKLFLFQNHAASMCEGADGSFITEDEAHYICAILNAPIVERFIYATSDPRSFKIRPPVYVPLYNPEDKRHQKLSSKSKEAHQNPDKVCEIREEVERIYLEICREK